MKQKKPSRFANLMHIQIFFGLLCLMFMIYVFYYSNPNQKMQVVSEIQSTGGFEDRFLTHRTTIKLSKDYDSYFLGFENGKLVFVVLVCLFGFSIHLLWKKRSAETVLFFFIFGVLLFGIPLERGYSQDIQLTHSGTMRITENPIPIYDRNRQDRLRTISARPGADDFKRHEVEFIGTNNRYSIFWGHVDDAYDLCLYLAARYRVQCVKE